MSQTADPVQPVNWARVQLMGHVDLIGMISKPGGPYGDLWQLDVPDKSTTSGFRTEYFGNSSVYRMIPMSKETALQFIAARGDTIVYEYDAPLITRAEHERKLENERNAILAGVQRQLERASEKPAPLIETWEVEDKGDDDDFESA